HGVVLHLTAENLAMLDLPNEQARAIDPVVTPEQLPAGGIDPSRVARRDAERRLKDLQELLTTLDANVQRTAVALEASRQALADGEARQFAPSDGTAPG